MPKPWTPESALRTLQRMFPNEFFRVSVHEDVEINEAGEIWVRGRWSSVLQLSRGLDGFYNAPTLEEAMSKVFVYKNSLRSKPDATV